MYRGSASSSIESDCITLRESAALPDIHTRASARKKTGETRMPPGNTDKQEPMFS